MRAAWSVAALLPLALACARTENVPPIVADAPPPLDSILASPALADVLRRAPDLRVQIAFGWVDREREPPVLEQRTVRTGEEYFYPASAVKLFAAVAALERLAELRAESGHPLDLDTPLRFHPLFDGETLQERDDTNLEGGTITVRHEIRKLFLVSDNEAFNRLYELVGQDRLMASLQRAGLGNARIVHRLDEARTPEENRQSPRIDFVGPGFTFTLDARTSEPLPAPPDVPGLLIGSAYLRGDAKVDGAMDFAAKNRISLIDLQRGLCKVLTPEVVCGPGGNFELTGDDRFLLKQAMYQFPRDSPNPRYDPAQFPDASGKLLLPGLLKHFHPDHFGVYNKYGQAYGFSTENSLIFYAGTGQEIFVAATLYTNADGVLNDDRYEYREVALPFFAALGEGVGEWMAAHDPFLRRLARLITGP